VITAGELEYQQYCAVCHGVDAKGHGTMRRFLTIEPSDLTQESKKNGGRYPFWQIYGAIDGREEVRGHGTRDMPIWGARFRSQAGGDDTGSKAQVAGRILGLVFYLQYLQEEITGAFRTAGRVATSKRFPENRPPQRAE